MKPFKEEAYMRWGRISAALLLAALAALAPARIANAEGEGTGVPGSGEMQLDLQAALELARRHNLDLQAERIDLQTAERASRNSWNQFLPSLDVSTGLSRSGTAAASAADSSPWSFSTGVSAGLSLSSAPRYRIQQTRLAFQAGEISYEEAVQQLDRDVKKAFYDLMVKDEKIRLVERNMQTAAKRYQQERAGYEKGLVSELTMLTARVAYENLRPRLEEARVAYRTAELALKQLIGLDRSAAVSLRGSLQAPEITLDAGALAERHLQERFDVQAQVNTVRSLENRKKLSSAEEFSPTLSLSYSYSTYLADPFHADWGQPGSWSGRSSVGVSLSMYLDGLVPGSSSRTRVLEAEDAIRRAGIELRRTVQQAELEIETLVLLAQKSMRTIQVLEQNLELAARTYELTEREYEAGITGLLELEDAGDNLREAEVNLVEEKYAFLSTLFDLEYALNTELDR
ncbi:MAG: TolC family protein [Spirochaetota bacterium]